MKKVGLLVILLLTLSACMPFSPVKQRSVLLYTLNQLPKVEKKGGSDKKRIAFVAQTTAAPGYRSAKMIYVDQPFRLGAFSQHAWVSSPANMLLPLLVQSLRDTGTYRAVVSPPFTGIADVRIDTQLLQFHQNFMTKPSQIQIALQVNVVNNVTNKVITSRRFSIQQATHANTPYDGVIAANEGISQLLSQVVKFVVNS